MHPLRSSASRWRWTVQLEATPISTPISRTVGGCPRSRIDWRITSRTRCCLAVNPFIPSTSAGIIAQTIVPEQTTVSVQENGSAHLCTRGKILVGLQQRNLPVRFGGEEHPLGFVAAHFARREVGH